jgi:dTDP-glucose 4,6-dehydratase
MLACDHGGPVNLGNPHEVSMLELAQWIGKLTRSRSEITLVPRPQDDPERRRPDIALARELLNWEPTTPVERGLCDTVTYFRRRLSAGECAGDPRPAGSTPSSAAAS